MNANVTQFSDESPTRPTVDEQLDAAYQMLVRAEFESDALMMSIAEAIIASLTAPRVTARRAGAR